MTRRPRTILYVCDFNAHGGTQTHLLHLLAGIDRSRFAPILATLNLDRGLAEKLAALDADVVDLGLKGALRPSTWAAALSLSRRARRRADLVHGYLFQGNILAAAVSRLSGVACITSVRNVDAWKRRRHRLASRLAHARAVRVLFNSEAVRVHTVAREAIPMDKTLVIPNGIPDPSAAEAGGAGRHRAAGAGRDPGAPKCICVASLRAKKGHAHLLEAFGRVLETIPRARLLLAGDGPLRATLQAEVEASGRAGAIAFLGHRADVAALLESADLFVLASLEEGMPNALLEAMAAGLPAVATDVGGNAEALADAETGYLVPPGDPGALARRLIELLSDEGLRSRFARAARRRFEERFTLQRMMSAYHGLYGELLD